jgi:hypothetical protein
MKAHFFLFAFLILQGTFVSAQVSQELILGGSDSAKIQIHTFGNGYYHSGDLHREFISVFYKGGFIDSTNKASVLEELKEQNTIGAELEAGIEVYLPTTPFFRIPGWNWFFSAKHVENYSLSFTDRLFELTFFGNANMIDTAIDLGPLDFQMLRFQKLGAGAYHKETKSRISFSFIKGEQFSDFHADRATYFSDRRDFMLALDLDGTWRGSDTAQKGLAAFNGWGMCTDLVWYLNSGKNRSIHFHQVFRLALENFGFIRWNGQSQFQQTDTTFEYRGIEVNNLLEGISNPFLQTNLQDTLGWHPSQEGHTQWLPFTFSLSGIAQPFSDQKIQGFYGIRLRAWSNYRPMFHAGIQYNPVKNIALSAFGAFGGYGGFRGGLNVLGKIGNHFSFGLYTGNIAGWFSKKSTGMDAGISLNAFF